jgi:hypothetical protein
MKLLFITLALITCGKDKEKYDAARFIKWNSDPNKSYGFYFNPCEIDSVNNDTVYLKGGIKISLK